jgi:hypothetical protein
MSRIRRGGVRLRAGGGRTREQDCCCTVTCGQINDSTWRSALEASYVINNLTFANDCSGTCVSSYSPGVLPYDNHDGTTNDWRERFILSSCTSCGGAQCYFYVLGRLECSGDNVTAQLSFRTRRFDGSTGGDILFDADWTGFMPIGDFALGASLPLTFTGSTSSSGPCTPTSALASSSATIMFQ